jgi:mutator protein MutT
MEKEKFLSSVYLIIKNDKGEILLQRRQGTKLWPGFLALPAGHIDEKENAYDAVIREAREELGIKISRNNIIDTFVVNRRNKSLMPYYDVYFEIDNYDGKIQISEPDKCSELVWSNINNLPEDMIDFEIEAIKNNQLGIKFSVIDTDNEKKLVLKQ